MLISRTLLLFILFGCTQFAFAQTKHTISGTLKEKQTGETLIAASISTMDGTAGAFTNEYGFYSLSLPETDTVRLVYSYVGYNIKVVTFPLRNDTTINIELSNETEIETISVTANSNREKLNSTQMGVDEITVKEAKEIPAIFGEVDIIKVLQLKPGVQSGGEGTSGLYVRGGSGDQNLFILDEAPVYNPSHLFGFFSTFNADAVKNVKLYKAGFPSRYGGKLSSVIDVVMREGNRKKFSGSGGLGLISSRLTLEGPIVKDKGSFIISGRRTYVDIFTSIINDINSKKDNPDWTPIPDYNFYDLNAKVNYDLGKKDRLFISGYFGRDVFLFSDDVIKFNFNWGNTTATARWNHIVSPKLFVNTSFTFSDYLYDISNTFDQFELSLGSGIRDANLKADFNWFPTANHTMQFGANAIYHRFSVNRFDAGSEDSTFNFDIGSVFHAGEFAAYFSDDWAVNENLKILFGIRLSGFYNEQKFYVGPEPRIAIKYNVHKNVSLKASYARMYQYIHLVAPSGASLPTDVWYPSNATVKPQSSDLVSAGVAWALGKDYFVSFEGYYKWLHGQIDFRDGAQLFLNEDLDQEFVFGKGWAYGGEAYIEKKLGDFRGWVGYTLSWSWRQFDDIMDGQKFHPTSDRRHDISVVLAYDIPKTPLTVSASWIYGTGSAISLPVARYFSSDITGSNPLQFNPIFTERNGFRMPAYHRMDVGMVCKLFPKKKFESDLTLSIYNLYSRLNAFFIYIEPEYAADIPEGEVAIPERFQAKVVSLFPIIPSLTWNFKF